MHRQQCWDPASAAGDIGESGGMASHDRAKADDLSASFRLSAALMRICEPVYSLAWTSIFPLGNKKRHVNLRGL
jgi:hypothetical protein